MNEINQVKRQKQYRLYMICQCILTCIRAKVHIAMSCSIRYITYTFRTVNTHGSPILPIHRVLKIRKFVVKKLQEEGFQVHETFEGDAPDTEWSIMVQW